MAIKKYKYASFEGRYDIKVHLQWFCPNTKKKRYNLALLLWTKLTCNIQLWLIVSKVNVF